MAKISELEDVAAPDGSEAVPILKAGVAKKTTLGALVSALAGPFVTLAQKWAEGTLPGGAGTYSAKEQALLADGSRKRAQNAVAWPTYAALSGATGMSVGDRATVQTTDTGTHTDPVVGGTVANSGLYQYSASPAGWQRIDDLDSTKANAAIAAGRATIASIFTRAGTYNTSGVWAGGGTAWVTTDYLELSAFDVTSLKLSGVTTVLSVAFWDANFGFISGVAAASNGAFVTSMGTIPGNAVYVTFTSNVAARANEVFQYAPKPNAGRNAIAKARNSSLFSKLFTITDKFYNGSGTLQGGTGWVATPLIELALVNLVGLRLQGSTGSRVVAWFDDAKAPISGVTSPTNYGYVTAFGSVPSGAKYVAFSHYTGSGAFDAFLDLSAMPVAGIRSDGLVATELSQLATNLGYINGTTGVFVASDNWLSSDFLAASPGDLIGFSAYGYGTVGTITWYDSSKARLASAVAPYNGVWAGSSTAPAGTAYVRFSFGRPGYGTTPAGTVNSIIENLSLAKVMADTQRPSAANSTFSLTPFKRPRAMKLAAGAVVVMHGDSRSDGTNLPPVQAAVTAYAPPLTILAKGLSGTTVAQQASDSQLSRIWDNNPDVAIWMPGGNDTGEAGTVGSLTGAVIGEGIVPQISVAGSYSGTYFVQAIDYVIRRFKAQYYNIRVRAALTGSETETEKNNKIRALKKPMLIVCTDLPQQRADARYGLAANLERKRQAIIEACAVNKVHCVDTMSAVAWDMSLEPNTFAPPGDPTYTNNGVWTLDGLHPNEFGTTMWLQIVFADAGLA